MRTKLAGNNFQGAVKAQSKGRVKKIVEFSTKRLTPTPIVDKNDLSAMKQILYDMGLLTHVRWFLQRAFKFEPPYRPASEVKGSSHTKIKEKKIGAA